MKLVEIQQHDDLYQQALELRYQLFFKMHNLPKSIVIDDKEQQSTHIAITQENQLIAYGRLSQLDKQEFQVSQMLVAPQNQNQGYGTKLLQELMQTAKNKGARTIMLRARTSAIPLYANLGFQQVGEIYNSQITAVPHIKMVHHITE